MRRITFIVIAWLAALAPVFAQQPTQQTNESGTSVKKDEVWKWVDADGVTHYSDQPGPGAVRVDLRVQTYETQPTTTSTPSPARSAAPQRGGYQTAEIVTPANDETFTGGPVQVSVRVRVNPPLRPGDAVVLLVDGQPLGQPSSSLNFTLTEVPRGTHSLQATVVNSNGDALLRGPSINFHVQQTGLLSPARRR